MNPSLRAALDEAYPIRMMRRMKVTLLTREFPPEVYGGAGVHVEYLARELARLTEVEVRCFGADRDGALAFRPPAELGEANPALQAMGVDLAMAADLNGAAVVHSHTWYANLAGHVAKLLHGVPHVATTHSLEPQRPWKEEQLGGGYRLSSFCERAGLEGADAVIAVSQGMREDVLAAYPALDPGRVHVILNGIDTEEYSRDEGREVLEHYGVREPYVLFVGRITRQKGLETLLAAAPEIEEQAQLVLAAGAPDTDEIARATEDAVGRLRNVVWIEKMLEKREVIQLLSHASLFVCPSIYEPLGIVNLEAMACGTAVVASRVGGIPEVVVDGETGVLVPPGEAEPLAEAVLELLREPERARKLGEAGRLRAVEEFGWDRIAAQTLELYRSLV
jgi:alpha-maltose-1-phosphate synthase